MKKLHLIALVVLLATPLLSVQAVGNPIFLGPPIKINQNLLINNGFEQAGSDESRAYGWHDFHNGYSRVNTSHTDLWGIKLQNKSDSDMSGAYQRIDLNQTEIKPVFIGGYVKGDNIKMKPGGWFGASLYAEIHLDNGQIAYWNSISNSGSFDWRWIGFNTGTLSQINRPISHIFVVPILTDARGTAYFDDISVRKFDKKQGAVTIMIDDAEISTYTEVKPVLDKYGFKASTAAIVEMIGKNGFMNTNQLKELQTNGWEIISHGITHTDLTTVRSYRAEWEMKLSKYILEALGLQIKNFALPFGGYNGNILGKGQLIYRSIRAYELGDNPQGAFPYDIKVRSVVSTTLPKQIAAWAQGAKDNKRWEIITFHTIATSSDDAYYTDPAVFAQMIQAIADSDIPVVTYDQGLDLFAVTK